MEYIDLDDYKFVRISCFYIDVSYRPGRKYGAPKITSSASQIDYPNRDDLTSASQIVADSLKNDVVCLILRIAWINYVMDFVGCWNFVIFSRFDIKVVDRTT